MLSAANLIVAVQYARALVPREKNTVFHHNSSSYFITMHAPCKPVREGPSIASPAMRNGFEQLVHFLPWRWLSMDVNGVEELCLSSN